ncbi:MAG TPA: SUMF1/EgtB/PvdO family nonheme iron enzyme, partial [Pyrinomonadaceae bacterium]|nr:SUMF1/EgtB/PvdO family nonheme iron enzyme [Pyrinomonadaceae bacterium]
MNDKPKQDDDWAMSNPNVNLKKELEAEGFTDREIPQQAAETSDEDWGVTTPNTNLAEHIPPSENYGQTEPNVNLSNEDWSMDAPQIEPPTAPQSEDWSMDAPTPNQTADTDKTAPNINLPQANFDSSMPYIPTSRENKREGWQMPQPVFRVSSGEKTSPRTPPNEFVSNDEQADFSSNQAAPQSAPMPEAKPAAAPVAKKRSKIPLILGGLFGFLFLSVAALAGVWFMFLRGGGEMASTSSNTAPTSTPADLTGNAPTNSKANVPVSATKPENNLPKEIDFKGKMVLVSAGSFTMGSDSGETISKPAHKVDLPAFYSDKTEVTNAQ